MDTRQDQQRQAKLEWVTPVLVEHGNLKDITQGCDKTFGSSDGFTFQGQAIVCTGS